MIPPLFLSHGAPTLPMTDTPARHFLSRLPRHLPRRPKAILAVSAHWETEKPAVSAMPVNTTIHDFYGFPAALYDLRYDAPGAPALAAEVAGLLQDAGLATGLDDQRGLDHGAWVPLLLAWPDADIPVFQLSLQTDLGPAHHLAIGRALAPMADRDVLIMGSGSFTHDLSEFRTYRHAIDAPEPDWVRDFAHWFDGALAENRLADLIAYRALAPHAVRNHPTEEHLLPLFVALGAAGEGARAERLHSSTTHGVLRMDVYRFGTRQ
jgi:4,5-DOPA dioxygenase extradiol